MNFGQLLFLSIPLAVAGLVIYLNAWRAVLFVRPASMRIEADEPPDQWKLPEELQKLAKWLTENGFRPLGSHWEKPLFTRETVSYDFVDPGHSVFATLYVGRDGGARLYLLTPIKGRGGEDGFVVTANYRRPARELPGQYYSGGLEEYAPDRVLKAHLRRLENEKLAPRGELTHEARIEEGRRWFQTFGQNEIRWQNLQGLLWTLGTVAMLVLAVIQKLR